MNEFTIGYMINPGLNVNKSPREQVEKCMNTIFSAIIQPFIKATFKKARVLALVTFLWGKSREYFL